MITELDSLREILYHAADLAADPLNEAARRDVRSAMKYYAGDDETLRAVAARVVEEDATPIGDYAPAWLLQEAATLEEAAKRQIITARRLRELYARHKRGDLARVMESATAPQTAAPVAVEQPAPVATQPTPEEPAADPLTRSAVALILQCARMTEEDAANLTAYAARQTRTRGAIVADDARSRSWPAGIAEIARLVIVTSAAPTTAEHRNRWQEIRHAARVLLPLTERPIETPAPTAAQMIELRDATK